MIGYDKEGHTVYTKLGNGKTSRYTYNHAGERIVKSHGSMEGVYINGAPQGITFHETDEYTLYPASIISVNKNRFTKHYFIGDKRIASRIGSGSFNNVYGQNGSFLTAGQQDYAERLNQIETQREDYYRELGIAPGVPTMKGSYGDPENTGVGYNTIIKELGDHTVPAEWAQYVKHNTEADTAPGAPIQWDDPSDPESALPGYGFVADNSGEPEETFYYHSDHLGSTSYITDGNGNITQYDAYLPYGELLVDEHSSSEDLPYKFNGKELDEETGLYYYGARYMNPTTSLFLNIDRFTEKYPHLSAYNYCASNPIRFLDINGDSLWINYNKQNILYSKGNLYLDGNPYIGKNKGFLKEVCAGLKDLNKTDEGRALINQLDNSTNNFVIKKGNNNFIPYSAKNAGANLLEVQKVTGINTISNGSGGIIYWDPYNTTGGLDVANNTYRPSFIGLGHEFKHGSDSDLGLLHFGSFSSSVKSYTNILTNAVYNYEFNGLLKSEWRATYSENLIRQQSGIPLRAYYGYDISTEIPQPIGPCLLGPRNSLINYPNK